MIGNRPLSAIREESSREAQSKIADSSVSLGAIENDFNTITEMGAK